jgi:hypothetical protein
MPTELCGTAEHSNPKSIAIDMENDVAKKARCLLGWLKKPRSCGLQILTAVEPMLSGSNAGKRQTCRRFCC